MGKIKEYKTFIGSFIQSDKGQRFFNFAYSIGAAIVIWGALFKILHLPGGNFLLSLGMGTEVLMFTLTAFDRPPKQYKWEEVFPVLDTGKEEDRPDFEHGGGVVVNGGAPAAGYTERTGQPAQAPLVSPDLSGASPAEMMAGITSASQLYVDQLTEMTRELRHLQESTRALNSVSDVLLESYRAITENSENITRSSNGYVEQMQDLNRNISGLNTIYEIQLKSVSSQLDAIDRVNRGIKDIGQMYEQSSDASSRYCAETEKMARYMRQLNSVYEKMITAMTINMYNPMAAAAAAAASGAASAQTPVPPVPPAEASGERQASVD